MKFYLNIAYILYTDTLNDDAVSIPGFFDTNIWAFMTIVIDATNDLMQVYKDGQAMPMLLQTTGASYNGKAIDLTLNNTEGHLGIGHR